MANKEIYCPRCGKLNRLAGRDGHVEGPREFHAKCWGQYVADAYCENESTYGYKCGRKECPHCFEEKR